MQIYREFRISVVALLVVILFAGCNSDIFVEQVTPSASEVTIDGDGGTCTVRFQPKGLKYISLDTYHTGIYYNKAGEEISEYSPASEVARINYTDNSVIFDVIIDDDKLTVTSTEQTYDISWQTGIQLDYGYTAEFIGIEILPGKPAELIQISYLMENMTVQSVAKTDYISANYHNGGASEVNVKVMPYIAQQASATLEPDDISFRYLHLDAPLPTCVDGMWIVGDKNYGFELGTKLYYFPELLDRHLEVPVTIPPYSDVKVTSVVLYSSLRVPFCAVFRNPVSGRERFTFGVCGVLEPVSYDIQITDVK